MICLKSNISYKEYNTNTQEKRFQYLWEEKVQEQWRQNIQDEVKVGLTVAAGWVISLRKDIEGSYNQELFSPCLLSSKIV